MHYKPEPASWIEISKSALAQNIKFIQKSIPEKTIFSAVVKGDAYGHGIETYGPLAYECRIRHFSVYSAQEAYQLLQSVRGEFVLMIMGTLNHHEMMWAIEHNIEFYVPNFHSLENVLNCVKKSNLNAKIHLEFETGMNRTGFAPKDFKPIMSKINETYLIEIKGVCTHLAGSESIANYKRIKDQIQQFQKIKKKFELLENHAPKYHIACSAAVLRYPKYVFDMVRVGILQYGFFPNNETYVHHYLQHPEEPNPLKRVISWKSKVIEVKTVNAGEFIGYGTSFYTNIPTKIAIVPVGYAYGYSRKLSNQGKALVNGFRVDVIGSVNMNMLTLDVTNLPDVQIGDEVVLIGSQAEQTISLASFSENSNQLNYELLARLPKDIKRIVVD
ncbi:alanine racemase [Flavobacterium sp. CBA20B-1]|uniref:alanine racemase n=1 Tax=unclassified Flavobacterium TaxID=196869 RepID=UPI002224A937|nr:MULTISPECIES: alanine racemase [unclassified Flavobacterium]WCM42720.1 alanine racemase [Flavobacterium sp. CBA20B-1]